MTEWMTPQQVASKTKRHVSDVRRALEHGDLHGHQKCPGGRWRIDPACVDPWMCGEEYPASRDECVCQRRRSTRAGRAA